MSSTSSYSDDEELTLVFDIGSNSAYANFAGEDAPNIVLDNLCYPNTGDLFPDGLSTPRSVESSDEIISKCIDELFQNKNTSHNIPMLFTEPIKCDPVYREGLAGVVFEKYEAPAFFAAPSPILSLYASGRGSGIVVESGHSYTSTAAVYEGYLFEETMSRQEFGGADVTKRLFKELHQNVGMAECNRLKEKYLSASDHTGVDMVHKKGVEHLNFQSLIKCTDILFDNGERGIPEITYEMIMEAPIGCRKDLFSNIVLSGGNTLMTGFKDKVQARLEAITSKRHSKNLKVRIIAPPERKYSPWIGGSILGSLSSFQSMWVTKKQYEECGPSIVHKMCSLRSISGN